MVRCRKSPSVWAWPCTHEMAKRSTRCWAWPMARCMNRRRAALRGHRVEASLRTLSSNASGERTAESGYKAARRTLQASGTIASRGPVQKSTAFRVAINWRPVVPKSPAQLPVACVASGTYCADAKPERRAARARADARDKPGQPRARVSNIVAVMLVEPNAEQLKQARIEAMRQLPEAYTVLSDPEKRALYDRYGESWREAEKKGRSPTRSRAQSVPTSKPRRKRRRQDDLLEHTERRLGISVAGIELIGVGVTVDVRTGLLDEEEASDGTHAQPTARQLPPRKG